MRGMWQVSPGKTVRSSEFGPNIQPTHPHPTHVYTHTHPHKMRDKGVPFLRTAHHSLSLWTEQWPFTVGAGIGKGSHTLPPEVHAGVWPRSTSSRDRPFLPGCSAERLHVLSGSHIMLQTDTLSDSYSRRSSWKTLFTREVNNYRFFALSKSSWTFTCLKPAHIYRVVLQDSVCGKQRVLLAKSHSVSCDSTYILDSWQRILTTCLCCFCLISFSLAFLFL